MAGPDETALPMRSEKAVVTILFLLLLITPATNIADARPPGAKPDVSHSLTGGAAFHFPNDL